MTTQFLQRHPQNVNLHLLQADEHQGLPLNPTQGPFILEYLDRVYATLGRALDGYPDGYALCFTVSCPAPPRVPEQAYGNGAISSFWQHLKGHIGQDAIQQGLAGVSVRYLWSRQQAYGGLPSYRCCVLLPKGLYSSVGVFNPADINLYHHLCGSWASSLGLALHEGAGLVDLECNGELEFSRTQNLDRLFLELGALSSAREKAFGNQTHWFGSSKK